MRDFEPETFALKNNAATQMRIRMSRLNCECWAVKLGVCGKLTELDYYHKES